MSAKPKKPSLAETHPDIANEWHPTKNNELTPHDVTYGSNRKVWWLCSKCGHEWETHVKTRAIRKSGCPICRYVKNESLSLANLYPDIAAQWHPTKNGKLKPDMVPAQSCKKVWWRCEHGHEWQSFIDNRTSGRNGRKKSASCPICRRTNFGRNTLSKTHPNIAAQWHPTKNGTLTPDDVSYGSHKQVWWIDEHGHEWQASVDSRTQIKNRKKTRSDSKLSNTDKLPLAKTHPDIAAQWHPIKNGELTSFHVTHGSQKRIWWLCDKCGHEWQTRINQRTLQRTGCPKCSLFVKQNNSLQETAPDIAAEWHPTKNGALTPEYIAKYSNKTVWWLCPNGHPYLSRVVDRTLRHRNCPHCRGNEGRSALLTGYNDLATANPELIKEWHPTKNGTLTPDTIMRASSQKVWWLCDKCGHEWQTKVHARTIQHTDCPECAARRQTSFPEQAIRFYLKHTTPTDSQHRFQHYRLDIYLPKLNCAIEYNGAYWHKRVKDRSDHDTKKRRDIESAGIRLITVEDSCENNNVVNNRIYIVNQDKDLPWAIEQVFALLELPQPDIDIKRDRLAIEAQYKH